MSVETIGAVLDRIQAYEHRLEAYYADLRDRTTNDGVRLLTYSLARRKRHLPGALNCYPPEQIRAIRETPLRYDGPGFDPRDCIDGRELSSAAKAEELLDAAIGFVAVLIGVYRWLAERPLGGETGALFRSLQAVEETDIVELKKIRAMDYF